VRPIVTLTLIFLITGIAYPQEPEGWLIPFSCAYQPDLSGFNHRFIAQGLPQAKNRLYGWGIELRSCVSNNILLGPLYFRTWDNVENEKLHLHTETWGILGEFGIKLPIFKFLTIVPLIGIGGVQPSFHLRQKTGDLNLDSLLTAPGKIAVISPGIKLTGMAAFEVNLLIPTTTGSYGLSLRSGYLYSPLHLDWRLANGARITNTPDSKIQGPWFSLGITLIPAPETHTE